jgi:predicted ATPase/DNA-binding winged helix-turn-helix (wHTH) protein
MPTDNLILFPPFRLELANEQLWRDKALVPLRPKSFAVLRYLVEHPGRLVTREELRNAIWPGIYVSEGLLRSYIRELREILEDDAEKPRFIETVPRRGFRFLAPVTTATLPILELEARTLRLVPSPTLPDLQSSSPQSLVPDAQHSALSTQHSVLVGREAELAQLHEWLEKAASGERQLVFVTGEPGIGKTTLVETFLADIGQQETSHGPQEQTASFPPRSTARPSLSSPWIGQGQCVEHYGAGEAYLPILDALGRLCRQPGGEQLIATLYRYAPTWLVQMPPLVSDLEFEALQRKVQGSGRERMLHELAEAIEVFTATHLLVLVLEDLHWCDYSTLDLLGVLARRRELARLCIIGTYRPADVIVSSHPLRELKQELQSHRQCDELALSFLTEQSVAAYLTNRFPLRNADDRSSLQALAHSIHHQTDGNPLFMVNLIDYWTNEGVLPETSGRDRQDAFAGNANRGVPESLQQMVEKQLERLTAEDQYLLEVASVAGEEFSAAAVAVGAETRAEQVDEGYEGLAARGQFVRSRGMDTLPNGAVTGRYRFLHAIYQHILYERLSAIRRIRLHRAIGEKMEHLWGAQAHEHASTLAVHFEFGQAYPQAIQYLWLAAENARRKHAYHEAAALLTKSLSLLPTQPDTLERRQQELALLVSLGVPLLMTKGYAAPEVEHTYARARALCQELGESPQLLPALAGLFRFYFVRAEFQLAQEFGAQVLRLAQSTSDAVVFLIAHSMLAVPLVSLGELTAAREQFEKVIMLYDPQQHRFIASLYGDDPGIICLALSALALWFLGYPAQALRNSQKALALAQDLALPYNVAFALDLATWIHFYRGESQAAQACIEALSPLVSEQGFQFFAAESLILQGWVLAEQGQGTEGLMQMRPGLTAYRATGAEMSRPSHLGLLAKTYGKLGQVEEGLDALAEAFAVMDRTGERCLEAELYRLKGELLLRQGQVAGSKSKKETSKTPRPTTKRP